MQRISLKECPKVYILETHRSRTPESTLRFIETMKDLIGMLSFQDAACADRIGLPVFTCSRVRPDGSSTSHTGKGVSGIQAQVSLVMESIERYSSEFRDEYRDRLIKGSWNRLRTEFNALDPRELILSRYVDFTGDEELHWTWGTDLFSNENVLVPACAVYHPFHLDKETLVSTNTNGLASGNTMEEAVFHGLTELIERDAWSIAKFNEEMNEALEIEDLPEHRFLAEIVEKFERADVQVTARNITSDIGVPVIAAFSQDLAHPDMTPIEGFGAHLDPKVAMARALLELATTRAFFIQSYGFSGLRETATGYFQDGETWDPRFHASARKSLGEMDAEYSSDILADIRIVMGRMEKRGLNKLIVCDLTRGDTNVPVVRTIVPGLEAYCFDRGRRGERLMKIRVEEEN